MPAPSTAARGPSPAASTVLLATLAMLAFAGNSLLCRLALTRTGIDPAAFTGVRLLAGALVLGVLAMRGRTRGMRLVDAGSWGSAMALFAYAAAFSFAYTGLSAATGALLLFGAVQVTMIGAGLWRGERLGPLATAGLLLALAGLVALLAPGVAAPPAGAAALMATAGVAWGVYSLRGAGGHPPLQATAANFLLALPAAAALALLLLPQLRLDAAGLACAVASGAVTSGLGYAAWYAVLPRLRALRASVLQLSVPVLTAAGGVLLLGEPPTLRLLACGAAVLGGMLVVVRSRQAAPR